MKKLFLFVIAIFTVVFVSSAMAKGTKGQTDLPIPHNYQITFKAVLSSPIDIPENYGVFSVYANHSTFSTMEYSTLGYMALDADLKIPSEYMARPTCYGDGITFEGWDIDPYTYDFSEQTEDITFTAYFNNDDAIPVFLSAVEGSDDYPCSRFVVQGDDLCYPTSTALMFFKPGHVLEKSDRPAMRRYPILVGGPVPQERYWSSPFEGTVVNEPLSFKVTFWTSYKVYFEYMIDSETWTTTEMQRVYHSEDAIPPEDMPEIPGYTFCGWDRPLTITKVESMELFLGYKITAVYAKLGDANDDGIINTSDAVSILRSVVSAQELTNKQFVASDVNCDSAVNTADAVRILRYTAKLISEL